jgi:peptidoglycan/xylan/chitin deacetylase (PgdA/CDA1 family)
MIDRVLSPIGSIDGAHSADGDAAVALTFDDGPDAEATPAVLSALAQGEAKATFFVLADRARARPGLVRRLVAEGHEVGLHGPDHRRITTLDPAEVATGMREARAELEELAGREVRWYRPPYGAQTARNVVAARRAGMTPVVWTAAGADWDHQHPREIARRIAADAEPGGVVLLHDGLAGDSRHPDAPDPLEGHRGTIVSALLDLLAADGMTGTTVGALVAGGRPRKTTWFKP